MVGVRGPLAAAALVLAALLAVAAMAGTAAGDGDPASDVLLGTNVFYPYTPPVSASVQKTLNAETAATAKAGMPVKVALIGSPIDLGVIPDLFGKPQRYAEFLDQEISFQHRQPLLVVMAKGYGSQGLSPAVRAALAAAPPPSGTTPNDLAQAAIVALARMAKASGHPVDVAGVPGSSSSGSGTLLIALVAVAVLLAAGLAAVTLQRRREERRADA